MKQDVKQMVEGCNERLAQMELVDSLQRLGVSYHFEKEIEVVMDVGTFTSGSSLRVKKQQRLLAEAVTEEEEEEVIAEQLLNGSDSVPLP
ncbi:hypothetical protein EJ110_NYTH48731 [Nymphaea thermarum]|nr:hypothetical protein EJ110_NYTH48731 [Nymphaea thermarum]